MAFGFPPNHEELIVLDSSDYTIPLTLAVLAAENLGWEILHLSKQGFFARTSAAINGLDADITVLASNQSLQLCSQSHSGIFDFGKNHQQVDKFLTAYYEIRSSISEEKLASKLLVFDAEIEEEEVVLEMKDFRNQSFLSLFIPAKGYAITPILIYLNVLIYLAMVLTGVHFLEPESADLMKWGANLRASTLDQGYWRLISCCFIHIGLIHLLLNMYALIYIGYLLEPLLGRTRFLTAYLLAGLFASCMSLWWHDRTISAGASGAIFGLYGIFLALLSTNIIEKNARKALLASMSVFVGYNLIIGMNAGIDNAAHIGGLIGGLALGFAMLPSLKKPDNERLKYTSLGLSGIGIIAICIFGCIKTPNDIGIYENRFMKFAMYEEKALGLYKAPADSPTQEVLKLAIDGQKHWKRAREVVYEMRKLDLPTEYRARIELLEKYVDARLGCFELIEMALIEHTSKYDATIAQYDQTISELLKKFEAQ